MGITDGPHLPTSFDSVWVYKRWTEAIDREFVQVHTIRSTCSFTKQTANLQPVPFTWTYRAKQFDEKGEDYSLKHVV